jgi:hypothetical protein
MSVFKIGKCTNCETETQFTLESVLFKKMNRNDLHISVTSALIQMLVLCVTKRRILRFA